MKVLISAYACEPGRGSEPGVGWNVVRELSARHELWVLTRANNEAAIRGSGEAWVEKVHWVFLDPPGWMNRWKRTGWGLQAFYLQWQRLAAREGRRLMTEQDFDVVHHLTFGSLLPVSPLAELGVPFVAGPLGGGERIPAVLFDGLSLRDKWGEWSRESLRDLVRRLPEVKRAYRAAGWCLAATPETAELLRAMGVERVSVGAQSGMGEAELRRLAEIGGAAADAAGPLTLVTASRLIPWKAVDLAVEAVGRARDEGLEVNLTVMQDGPERERLERQVRELGLGDRVEFTGRLATQDEVWRRMAAADALLHPAYHEVFGQVCLEALALGVPVICLDAAGPGRIIDDACGQRVRAGRRTETVDGLVAAMRRVLAQRDRGEELAAKARARAREFTWAEIAGRIDSAYRMAVETRSDGPRTLTGRG